MYNDVNQLSHLGDFLLLSPGHVIQQQIGSLELTIWLRITYKKEETYKN